MKILNAEKDLYLFDDDDSLPELQQMACIGAGLDVAVYRVTEEQWATVLAELETSKTRLTIIDCRKQVA